MGLQSVDANELAKLLSMYDSVDDLAQDLSSGVNHENTLAELWGLIKGKGQSVTGYEGYDAYALPDASMPQVIVESDGTVMPTEAWTQLTGHAPQDAITSRDNGVIQP